MRVALLSLATTPSRVHASLAAGLEARGHEVEYVLLDEGSRSAVLAALLEHSGDFDIVHNGAATVVLAAHDGLMAPIVTSLPLAPNGDFLEVCRALGDRTQYLAPFEEVRGDEIDYAATIAPGISIDAYRRQVAGNHVVLIGAPLSSDVEEIVRAAAGRHVLVDLAGLPDEQRADVLAGAAAAIDASEDDEPFGWSMLEALASGVPVIARDRPTTRAVVEPGRTGFLVEGDDFAAAIARLGGLDRDACRARAEDRFSLDRCVTEHLRVYEQIVAADSTHRVDTLHDRRPWGEYRVLENADDFKVKRIDVLPGQRLSYQKHARRSEHWMVVRGRARVTLDGETVDLAPGGVVDIPVGTAHRIENPGGEILTFVEIQHGSYFGEDDIVRLEDDFGRAE